MKLSELRSKGGFVSAALVPKEVTWVHTDDAVEQQADTFTVHVRRVSFGTVERMYVGADDQSKSAALLAHSIRLGDGGKEALSYDDAYQLDPGLAAVLIAAVNDVNGTGQAKPKN